MIKVKVLEKESIGVPMLTAIRLATASKLRQLNTQAESKIESKYLVASPVFMVYVTIKLRALSGNSNSKSPLTQKNPCGYPIEGRSLLLK